MSDDDNPFLHLIDKGHTTVAHDGLTDDQWEILRGIVDGVDYKTGRRPADKRSMVNGVIFKNLSKCSWRKIPPRYGKWQTIFKYAQAWQAARMWGYILHDLAVRELYPSNLAYCEREQGRSGEKRLSLMWKHDKKVDTGPAPHQRLIASIVLCFFMQDKTPHSQAGRAIAYHLLAEESRVGILLSFDYPVYDVVFFHGTTSEGKARWEFGASDEKFLNEFYRYIRYS